MSNAIERDKDRAILESHLEESFFQSRAVDSSKKAEHRKRMVNQLATLGIRNGTKIDILKYCEETKSPAEIPPPEQFALVHLTGQLPDKNGVLWPTSKFDKTAMRETIHAALNSAVSSNVITSWSGKCIAVIIPFSGATHWLSNFYTVDSFGFGPLKLPSGTVILVDAKIAQEHGLKAGQSIGRANVKIIDLKAEEQNLNKAGIMTKAAFDRIFKRAIEKRGINVRSSAAYNLNGQLQENFRKKSIAVNTSLESPMHFAVIRELLSQGKLPMASGQWSWAGWVNNGGLSKVQRKYGFTGIPHQNSIGHLIEEESMRLRESKNPIALRQNIKYMKSVITGNRNEFPLGGNKQRITNLLMKRVNEFATHIGTRGKPKRQLK
ncbi:Uncharacterised protein [uncultured archaeon]|nr:Uncharacterised protein [uncultured archaeon]